MAFFQFFRNPTIASSISKMPDLTSFKSLAGNSFSIKFSIFLIFLPISAQGRFGYTQNLPVYFDVSDDEAVEGDSGDNVVRPVSL